MEDKIRQVVVLDAALPAQTDVVSAKSGVTKKTLIKVTASLLITAIVVAGILVGVYFFVDYQKDVVKRTFDFVSQNSGTKVNEEISANAALNLLQYHTLEDGQETWIIEDYNRNIRIVKGDTTKGFGCYVAILKGSVKVTTEAIENVTIPDNDVGVQVIYTYYELSETPIKDMSLLGPTGVKLCTGYDVYWATKQCRLSNSDEPGNHLQKRAATGPQGYTGQQGSVGQPGAAGPQGSIGSTGQTGASGSRATGSSGNVGQPGAAGPQGPKGATGQTGGTGLQGQQGSTGNTGNPSTVSRICRWVRRFSFIPSWFGHPEITVALELICDILDPSGASRPTGRLL